MRSKALQISTILLLAMGVTTVAKAQSVIPESAKEAKSKVKILGNVYGGGNEATVQGNTNVEINKGQFAGDIFGGGNGALNPDGSVKASADIGTRNADGTLVENTGATKVVINGGEILYDDVVALDGEGHVQKDAEGNTIYSYKNPSNHNVYGGGNLACNVAGDTHVEMKKGMISLFTFFSNRDAASDFWQHWYDQAMNPNTQKKPIASVFGAGYGAHTDVAGNTNVNINISGTTAIHPADGESFTHAELEDIDKIIQRWQPDPRVAEQFVTAVHGGGYDGTVGAYDMSLYNKDNTDPTHAINYNKEVYTSQTNVTIAGQPFIFHVYGGGLGSKAGADANGNVNSHVGAVYGATKVDIQGGIINGDVFGGGAGIAGQHEIENPFPGAMGGPTVNLPYTFAAQVMRETDVTIDGKSTVIFGNVYGGGDIANTGWYVDGARPALAGHVLQQNHSLGVLDYTTSLNLNGGNVLGKVFGGGNGRKKSEVEQYKFVGAVIGSTNVSVNGSKIWNTIYGGGNTGCVYSCQGIAATQGKTARTMATATFDGKDFTVIDGSTNVAIFDGFVAQDIFGGGYGDDPIGDPEQASSADIYGNTFVYFERGQLEFSKYWKPREIATREHMGSSTEPEVTGQFLDQNSADDKRNTESDVCHNLYGGGNMACTVKGHTHVYMTGAPVAPADFKFSDYYTQCIANVAKPHFSVFGGGFGALAIVDHNAYSDINLREGTGFHSIIGGGMNGPVTGTCLVHVGNDPNSRVHHVYGGGYYAPCKSTELQITRGTILENVFGGSVMGNIWAENDDPTKVATTTIIGLQNPIDGKDRHSSVKLDDENGVVLRSYTYAQHQNQITIGGNVYGANDVSGTVNGVASLTIYGGTIKGDVYGAGNGDHIGYYVPDELRYDMGAHGIDNYFAVVHDQPGAPNGKTYVGRPQTIGGVELTMEGNTADERVTVLGQVFGGGNSCTIGAWDKNLLSTTYFSNPHLVRDDPAYFLGGGKIDMNLGSHLTIGRTHTQLEASADGANYLVNVDGKPENVSGLYMGCSGRHLATQEWSKTDNYYHHYYDASTAQYWPGFAVYQDNSDTPLTRQEGLQSFLAYMNNILVWSDDVRLNIKNQDNTDADDIWISNFVGGGFRGSMKAKTENGQFHYTLPRGVTIGHDVIGGAFNTDVVYRIFETTDGHSYTEEDGHYKYLTNIGSMTQADESNTTGDYHHIEYADDGTTITGIARFYYNGGMLSELAYGTPKASNDRINRILKKYSTANSLPVDRDVNKDFTGTGLNDPKAFNYYKRDALVYLELDNRLEVEYVDGHVHGGNVFGGCFSSGRVEGDIWTDYRCFQESQQANSEDFNLSDQSFNNAKNFEDNFAMMLFGAGYGANTNIQGSAYVRVLHPKKNPSAPIPGMAYGYPRLYNVFGGSYEGKVEGNTNIYFNPGKYGYVTGAIYGGGCNGYVGGKTYLELAGGYIDEAYGGARNANVGGGTHIWAYDGQKRWWGEDVIHSSGAAMTDADAEKAPLFIGKLYGGTDISGQICTDEAGNYTATKGYQPYYTAEFWPKELYTNHEDNSDGMTYIDTYLQVGGIDQSDNGFPIIGSVYAAGNGENTKSFFDAKYAKTNKNEDKYTDAKLPHQHSTLMEVSDGNIVYAFGGGNRATVTDQNYILVRSELGGKHTIEDLGVQMYDVMKKRILSVGVDCYDEKLVDSKKVLDLKNASIQRLFGGNNIATMAIQPKWQLLSGRVNNVYSGGNMGNMTYYNPEGKAATKDGTEMTGDNVSGAEFETDGSNSNYHPRGLAITIEHPEIHIGSLYGGCRLSDVIPGGYADDGVTPLKKAEFDAHEDYYGATINITDGYIENVYGGNDISGTVHFGTNVNISGAVSGNVYGSGNGFYLYKYDDRETGADTQITEHLLRDFDSEASDKMLCYTVPGTTGVNNTAKLVAINNARPSVEKAFLNIAGLEHYPTASDPKRVAYVKGNVFCGGNASTIIGEDSFSKFKIGSYVTLNGVFMGSDGYAYTQQDEIARFAKLNGFTDMGEATSFANPDDAAHNPILLNVYMMAVDMKAMPKDFNLNLPLKEAHIGTYCGGGNRGSMLVDKTVSLPFHHDIIIYDKIVGACLDANVVYNQNGTPVKSFGGFSRAVDVANNGSNGNTKLNLEIASQFVPLVMDVPADKLPTTVNAYGENFETAQAHDFMYANGKPGVKYDYEEFNALFDAHWTSQEEFESKADKSIQWKIAPNLYGPSCNIYGGCYQTGEVEGDIVLNVHSNMLRYVNKELLDETVANNIACFNIYGAGFGQDSHVWGNVKINIDRSLDKSTMGDPIALSTLSDALANQLGGPMKFNVLNGDLRKSYDSESGGGYDCTYPSFNNVFGGGRNGKLIGNTEVALRNGFVYSDVAGGCYASDMYGSSHVILGYPVYYRCNTSGTYGIERGDKWNTDKKDFDGGDVIKQNAYYLKGDLVPDNVYQQIKAHDASNASKFDPATVTPSTWDDVYIKVGRGVYGGGYSLANSTAASAGSITTHKLNDSSTTDLHPHNFNGRHGIDIASTLGYGGNSNIMVGDQAGGNRDHIHISTLKPSVASYPSDGSVNGLFIKETVGGKEVYTQQGEVKAVGGVTYYNLAGDGGIYGDGHLTFCEGFRAADVTRYGYAEGTPKYPVLMNTFQRMDLLSLNDCCLMLQGAQDFATDQIDATIYSITRVNELRMNSTIDANGNLGQITTPNNAGGAGQKYDEKHQRNYLAFYNNVHYLGSLVTNDKFEDSTDTFHGAFGGIGTTSYRQEKANYISAYTSSSKDQAANTAFKQRNVGTSRNAIGINNGYCLRIQNQEYVGTGSARKAQTYYGPIVGVCEVKLLTLVQGEGGGYVYADNIHADENNFLNTSGNFVFPGIVNQGTDAGGKPIGDQYIVDDCFLKHYGTPDNITNKVGNLDEAHYWYVEGNKYFYNTTLTGFTYQEPLEFDLIDNDPNVILSGMENGSQLQIKKVEWLSSHRAGYETVLQNTENPAETEDYEFDMQVAGTGTSSWTADMLRNTDTTGTALKEIGNDNLPQFNIHLQDKDDNSGDAKYINHLDEPELVKIYLEGKTKDSNGNWQTYEYTITLNIIYLQGPSFEGGVVIENCALPGELIGFSTKGLKIKTPELMPVTSHVLKIVPLSEVNETDGWKWNTKEGEVIPESRYSEDLDGYVTGSVPAHYKDNEYTIAYIFTAGGKDFPVLPKQTNEKKEERMIVVHNYHRMKDVVSRDLQVESMTTVPYVYADKSRPNDTHTRAAEAKLYIEDEEDLRAFIDYLNMATATYTDGEGHEQTGNEKNIPVGLQGLDVILQHDITLTQPLPAINENFAGNFHGDGYHIDLGTFGQSFFGDKLAGKVYNLGLVGGTISSVDAKSASGLVNGDHTVNSYEYVEEDKSYELTYGKDAYDLSHHFAPVADGYVENYYANGDYQYATTDRVWSLRTGAPNYNQVPSHHDAAHTHDADRWIAAPSDAANPDVLVHTGYNKPLYDATKVVDNSYMKDELDNVVGTKYGIPELYANDYLFFGQHLDLNNADAYPVHINSVANGDADKSKGGNRVYKTSGFYQSAVDQGFFYNRDAWALQPTLTAIDFTEYGVAWDHVNNVIADVYGYTTEGDGAKTTPRTFNVDSNLDYCGDNYDHKSYGHVTQNLLVYREHDYAFEPGYTGTEADYEGIWGEGIYADNTPESSIRYHLLRNVLEDGASYEHKRTRSFITEYFHLVDCQDFFAPEHFFINRRGWYERLPQAYRTVSSGYNSSTAWEGLCLPFPYVTRVYGEQPGNELSHFYGVPTDDMILNPAKNDRTLHHEYWLSGLTSATATEASFARPSLEGGDGLFTNEKQFNWYTYTLKNSYYNSLPNYLDNYGTRDDSAFNWYAAESHTFSNYPHITTGMPYLVAFPGESFYEFDLTGQKVTFEFISSRLSESSPMFYVPATGSSDDYYELFGAPDLTTSAGSAKHVGTYLHVKDQLGVNAEGTAFEAGATILPFRTYMTSTASPSVRRIVIRDGGTGTIETPEEEDVNIGDLSEPTMRIYGDGTTIVVESNYDTDLRVYSSAGRLVRNVHVVSGVNRYEGFHNDVYIIGGVKLRILE